jgi:hypothetical protein
MLRLRAFALLLAMAWAGTIQASEPPRTTTAHLLEGVRAFREGRFAEALVEFRVVERAPDAPAELAYYLGPTLYKLGRHREALQVFVTSSAPRDALSEFYFGTTLYRLKLYLQARDVFAALAGPALGPRMREGALRYQADIDRLYTSPPAPTVVDAYAVEVRPALARGELVAAAKLLEEALRVTARLRSPVVSPELAAAIAAVRQAADASLAAGDPARARPLYAALSNAPGDAGVQARAFLTGTQQ